MKRWTTLDGLEHLTRTEILDANDLIDALEEAEDMDRKKQDNRR